MALERFVAGCVLLALGCSSEASSSTDEVAIVPEGLRVTALPGGNGVLDVIALTLRRGPHQPELYAALKNNGEVPACHAAFSVELYDTREQSLAAGISGLLTRQFYRRTDGSGTIAACVAPGEVTVAAILDLPSELAVEDVGTIVYRCPYFALDVAPVDGLSVRRMKSNQELGGTTFTGTLVNGFEVPVRDPSVTVFAVNRVGRPLGMASGSDRVDVPPGGSWAFETDRLATRGIDFLAYPAAAIER